MTETTDTNEVSDARAEINSYVTMEDTGDYRTDCDRGRELADSLIERMIETENPTLLGFICRGIIDAGRWKAVHVGFFHRIAVHCIS